MTPIALPTTIDDSHEANACGILEGPQLRERSDEAVLHDVVDLVVTTEETIAQPGRELDVASKQHLARLQVAVAGGQDEHPIRRTGVEPRDLLRGNSHQVVGRSAAPDRLTKSTGHARNDDMWATFPSIFTIREPPCGAALPTDAASKTMPGAPVTMTRTSGRHKSIEMWRRLKGPQMKSDRGRHCAWTMVLLQASFGCAACASGNNEVLGADDAAARSVANSAAGPPPDAGQGGSDAGSSSGGDDSGPAGSPVTGGSDGGADGGSAASSGGDDSGAGSACTNPTCVVSNTGCTEGNYYLYDNQWNCGPTSGFKCGQETLHGCSYSSWYVTSNQPAGNTAVLTFPSVQENFDSNPLVSSFHAITSTFAETSPHVGDYEVAYDIWLNKQANEVMIWVDNYNQTPAGKKVASSVSLGGRTYDVWWSSSSGYIVFYANNTFTSGTVDILQIFNYAIQQTWLPSTSTLGQINLGVEVCSTGGKDATWYFNDFSITAN